MDTRKTDTIQDAETTIHIPTRLHRLNAPSGVEGTSGGKPEEICVKLPGRPLDGTPPPIEGDTTRNSVDILVDQTVPARERQ